jgi:hypothetical protein
VFKGSSTHSRHPNRHVSGWLLLAARSPEQLRDTMPCIHGLQQVIAAFITDLAHDDPGWTVAQ